MALKSTDPVIEEGVCAEGAVQAVLNPHDVAQIVREQLIPALERVHAQQRASMAEAQALRAALAEEAVRQDRIAADQEVIRQQHAEIRQQHAEIRQAQDRIAADQDRIAADQDRIAADQDRIAADQEEIRQEQAQIRAGFDRNGRALVKIFERRYGVAEAIKAAQSLGVDYTPPKGWRPEPQPVYVRRNYRRKRGPIPYPKTPPSTYALYLKALQEWLKRLLALVKQKLQALSAKHTAAPTPSMATLSA